MTSARTYRVLIVEDEPLVALALEDLLADYGYTVLGCVDLVHGVCAALRKACPDIAILDVDPFGQRALGIARQLRSHAVPIVFHSGADRDVLDLDGDLAGAAWVAKPSSSEDILDAIAETISRGRAASEPSDPLEVRI